MTQAENAATMTEWQRDLARQQRYAAQFALYLIGDGYTYNHAWKRAILAYPGATAPANTEGVYRHVVRNWNGTAYVTD